MYHIPTSYPYPYMVNPQMYNMYPYLFWLNSQMYNAYPYGSLNNRPMYASNYNQQYTQNQQYIQLKDYGPNPFVIDIDDATSQNNTFRTALWTGNNLQLTLMSINVGEDIGLEMHPFKFRCRYTHFYIWISLHLSIDIFFIISTEP